MYYLFDTTDGANAAGLSYVRVPLGASDFSAGGKLQFSSFMIIQDKYHRPLLAYSFDDVNGDNSFNNFNINAAPSYLFLVLQDILAVNNRRRLQLTLQLIVLTKAFRHQSSCSSLVTGAYTPLVLLPSADSHTP